MTQSYERDKHSDIVASFTHRGASHVRHNKPNQDAFGQLTLTKENIRILSVSDGHGSNRSFRSDIGSKLAVKTALEVSKYFFSDSPSISIIQNKIDILYRRIISNWKKKVENHLFRNPFSEQESTILPDEKDAEIAYGATLLLVIIMPTYLVCIQIGDGNIVILDSDENISIPIQADPSLIANDTYSLCQEDSIKNIQCEIIPFTQKPKFILLSTDGLANSFSDDKDFMQAVKEICQVINEHGTNLFFSEILNWLNEYTTQGSGDDITISLYYHGPNIDTDQEYNDTSDPESANDSTPIKLSTYLPVNEHSSSRLEAITELEDFAKIVKTTESIGSSEQIISTKSAEITKPTILQKRQKRQRKLKQQKKRNSYKKKSSKAARDDLDKQITIAKKLSFIGLLVSSIKSLINKIKIFLSSKVKTPVRNHKDKSI